jgi:transposase InsO family protein
MAVAFELALTASGCEQARVRHRPRLLCDNGPSYIAGGLTEWLAKNAMDHVCSAPCHPQTRQDRALTPDAEEPHLAGELLSAGDLAAQVEVFVAHYNHQRYHESLRNLNRPTSTSAAARPSCWNASASNVRPSSSGA